MDLYGPAHNTTRRANELRELFPVAAIHGHRVKADKSQYQVEWHATPGYPNEERFDNYRRFMADQATAATTGLIHWKRQWKDISELFCWDLIDAFWRNRLAQKQNALTEVHGRLRDVVAENRVLRRRLSLPPRSRTRRTKTARKRRNRELVAESSQNDTPSAAPTAGHVMTRTLASGADMLQQPRMLDQQRRKREPDAESTQNGTPSAATAGQHTRRTKTARKRRNRERDAESSQNDTPSAAPTAGQHMLPQQQQRWPMDGTVQMQQQPHRLDVASTSAQPING